MDIKTTKRGMVEEYPWGVYVWQTPDGEILGDGDGNIMNVFCMKGDQSAVKALKEAARHYGFPEGEAIFWSGQRPITDEEYQNQLDRAARGLVPDPFDIAAIKDEERALREYE